MTTQNQSQNNGNRGSAGKNDSQAQPSSRDGNMNVGGKDAPGSNKSRESGPDSRGSEAEGKGSQAQGQAQVISGDGRSDSSREQPRLGRSDGAGQGNERGSDGNRGAGRGETGGQGAGARGASVPQSDAGRQGQSSR